MDPRAVTGPDRDPARDLARRIGAEGGERLPEAVTMLVGCLSDVIRRLDPSREEMRAAIDYLTAVGQACEANRDEMLLLSDVLGLTSALERNLCQRPRGATPNTLLGPFYRPGAPEIAQGGTLCLDGRGEPLAFEGLVLDLDGAPVPGARIEVWHASGEGLYENQEPDRQPEFNLRGVLTATDAGEVRFRSARPGGTVLPSDGPVGDLMARLGLGTVRPAHIQVRIAAPGFQTLTTHVFDAGDPHVTADPLFAAQPDLLAPFERDAEGCWQVAFTFTLARAPTVRTAA